MAVVTRLIGRLQPAPMGRLARCCSRFFYSRPSDRPAGPREVLRETVTWYPGHMTRGSKEIARRLGSVHCVVEVRDARIPLTSRSETLAQLREVRPHLLLLNKADLAGLGDRDRQRLRQRLSDEEGIGNVFFTTLNRPERQRRVLLEVVEELRSISFVATHASASEEAALVLMVCGLPNVGKSTFINAARGFLSGRKAGARVGRKAGITRGVGDRILISGSDPPIAVLDTPGILEPALKTDIESLLRIGLCSCVDVDAVNAEVFVDYALYHWNATGSAAYVEHYRLPAPTDNVLTFLSHVAAREQMLVSASSRIFGEAKGSMVPDISAAARRVLKDIFDGRLGGAFYDSDLLYGDERQRIPFRFSKKK